MKKEPLIFEIKGNSLDDGLGIRSVVFFKGCPLSCLWCHNPESKKSDVEISFDPNLCIGCNTCIEICEQNALSRENIFFIDRKKCTFSLKCVKACPSGALSRVGEKMGINEILKQVLKDKPFYETSEGGVTLSGGEPLLFIDFASRLLKRLKAEGIHTLVETCGFFNFEKFKSIIFPYVDSIYFDIKLYNSDKHLRFCGVPNEIILENFKNIYSISQDRGVFVLPRIPLVPNITDTDSNLKSIAGFLQKNNADVVQLLPYHPTWKEKNRNIGIENSHFDDPLMEKWMSPERIDECATIFKHFGIKVIS